MPAAAAPKKAPVTPRPSASVIILTKSDKLLLVHRPNHLSFPNAHVFPGGVVSASDPSAAFCAARETFEETGLLFTTTAPPPSVDLPAAQTAIHSNTLTFNTFLSTHSLTLPLATFLPWSTWTTPPQAPKRYRSQFFLAELPAWIDELAEVRGDGGKEVVAGSARFVTPREALRQAREGEIVLFPPQLYMITMLAEALEAGGRERVREVSSGEFGGREVLPKLARRDEKGRLWMDVGGGDVVVVELAEGGKGEPRAVEVIKGAVKGAKL
ncbi:hypothetical protein EX30DRAFT_335067 [Ascodesmis nigricans]|uniref:Nudix hydrolase domain-containing protein n=1 Tax=Ascodesmis nigricans TaxID=341454 RepID=A0A4S2MLF0_9PEZI|nr:hypothetical protein EX30DRAFT_335067 [Ascodesmis nigricans]